MAMYRVCIMKPNGYQKKLLIHKMKSTNNLTPCFGTLYTKIP